MQDRKILKSVKVVYEIEGLNQDRLIEALKKRDIELFDVKKLSNRRMLVAVNFNQSKNFFAITKEMCYNIKKIKNVGRAKLVLYALKNAGLVLGSIAFVVCISLCNDLIFAFNFTGSGSVYSREIKEYLSERGVTEFTRFSSLRLDRLEDQILADTKNFNFVSVQKKGNVLEIYSVLKPEKPPTLGGNAKELVAIDGGVVESIKVYRGTAVVAVGDSVSAGDLLVGGFAVIKDQTVEMTVLAYVTVRSERIFTYSSASDKEQEKAILLAEEELADREILGSEVWVSNEGEKYQYTVKTEYRCVYYAG